MDSNFLIQYALMAGGAYLSNRSDKNKFPIPDGWTMPEESHTSLPNTGFEAVTFYNGTSLTDSNEIVISFAGTNPSDAHDYLADIELGAGLMNQQLLDAAEYYLTVKAANPNAKIVFAGHSLGGGLASLMGVFFDQQAITFDQAPFRKAASTRIAKQLLEELSTAFPASTDYLQPLAHFAAASGNDVNTLASRELKVRGRRPYQCSARYCGVFLS